MTSVPTPTSSFDVLTGPVHDRLLAAAAAATTRAVSDPAQGVLVIVVHPAATDHQVIAGGGTGVLRAAVSVAAAAGNDRAWRDAPDGDTAERPVRALPEVIAAAAEADGVRAVHVGCVRTDEAIESVAIWFETWQGVADADTRRSVLRDLAAAGQQERDRRASIVAAEPDAEEAPSGREFDPSDPALDALTGTLRAERFAQVLDEYDRDEAIIVLLDLDGFASVASDWDDATSDAVLREIADRLAANCRRDDVIARLGHDRFAILFGHVDRSEVVQIAKRLLASVAEPLPGPGPERVTATVALSHQVGLIDLDDMLESAADALASGKRAGAGRLVLAA
ncbi:MAG: GGDEF domain-containing protein [Acidimicrobiia bacterium]